MDQGSYVPPPMEPGTPERPTLGAALASGWVRAIGHAVLIFVVLAVIAEIVVFLLYAASEEPRPSATVFAKAGGGIFYSFNHAGMVFEVPRATIPPGLIPGTAGAQVPTTLAVRFTAVLPILLGTVLLIWLLVRAGRDLAREADPAAPLSVRAVNGAKVAIPYAVLCFGVAWIVRFSIPTPQGQVTIHPSYIAALLWPLGLGLLFGALGGLRSGGDEQWVANVWWQRARGALTGAGWMVTLGLAFSFAGLLVLAVVKPSATVDYFQGVFDQGAVSGIAGIVATLMVVPNMAAFILFPAMVPTCLTASAQVVGPSFSFCVLSWTQFPREVEGAGAQAIPTGALPNPPIGYYLFILAPLLAVILGGMLAARRGRAQRRQEAIGLGAAAGFVFGLAALVVIILSALSAHGTVTAAQAAQTQSFRASLRFGPDVFPGFLIAMAWGLIGGAVGGLIEGRRQAVGAPRTGPSWQPTAPAPPVPPG
ncbi:MAG TPA: DUF6350 family protein [Actinomycetota bacterium]|nr:DUF6350 family protein [Actinomycetota bacterium]